MKRMISYRKFTSITSKKINFNVKPMSHETALTQKQQHSRARPMRCEPALCQKM